MNTSTTCAVIGAGLGGVAMAALGGAGGVPTPVIGGRVAIASAMTGRDFVGEGRTLEALGLAGLDAAQIVARVR